MAKKLPRIYDPSDLFQKQVRGLFKDLETKEPLDGRHFTAVALTTTPTKVSHGLGRIPKGWYVTDITVATTVHRDPDATERNRYLTLVAGADCTVSLWIF